MQLPKSQKINNLFDSDRIVSVELSMSQSTLFVDVRTPKEFEAGAIYKAVNIPLFDNKERAEIGTLYKTLGQRAAIELGMDLVDSRLKEFVEKFLPFKGQLITIYCARGGMRSASVVRLLSLLGFNAQQLKGGYKSYRQHILNYFASQPPIQLIVLHGQTGVGKTRLLQKISPSIDLEGLAQHRSSLFGAVNRIPRTQKSFETHLFHNLQPLMMSQPIFIEGESRKVGDVAIPEKFFDAMKQGKMILLTASLETRIQRIIEDYVFDTDESFQQLEIALNSLRVFLSNRKVNDLLTCLRHHDFPTIVEALLRDYYDPRYLHSMKSYQYALTLSAEDLDSAAQHLVEFHRGC